MANSVSVVVGLVAILVSLCQAAPIGQPEQLSPNQLASRKFVKLAWEGLEDAKPCLELVKIVSGTSQAVDEGGVKYVLQLETLPIVADSSQAAVQQHQLIVIDWADRLDRDTIFCLTPAV